MELAQLRRSVPFGSGRDRSGACVRCSAADDTDGGYGHGGGGGRVRRSTLTSFFYPTALIAEVLVTWLILVMLCVVYLPLALLFYVLRREAPVTAAAL